MWLDGLLQCFWLKTLKAILSVFWFVCTLRLQRFKALYLSRPCPILSNHILIDLFLFQIFIQIVLLSSVFEDKKWGDTGDIFSCIWTPFTLYALVYVETSVCVFEAKGKNMSCFMWPILYSAGQTSNLCTCQAAKP